MSMLIGLRAAAMHVHRAQSQQRKRVVPKVDREKRAEALMALKRLARVVFAVAMAVIVVTAIVAVKSFVWIPHFSNP
jgi:hypothetical protein